MWWNVFQCIFMWFVVMYCHVVMFTWVFMGSSVSVVKPGELTSILPANICMVCPFLRGGNLYDICSYPRPFIWHFHSFDMVIHMTWSFILHDHWHEMIIHMNELLPFRYTFCLAINLIDIDIHTNIEIGFNTDLDENNGGDSGTSHVNDHDNVIEWSSWTMSPRVWPYWWQYHLTIIEREALNEKK